MVYCWDLHWVKKLENQEGLLDGDCVVSLLGVVLVGIIGISVGKTDSDKVGCWLGRILGTVLNTEVGNCEFCHCIEHTILVCALGSWCMPTGDGN